MPRTRQTRGRGRAADADPLLQVLQAGQDPAVLPDKPVQEPALPRRHRAQHRGGEPELGCGHCDALLPQVAGWQHQHRDRLTVALATRRSAGQKAATPQTHGLRDVLLQANREIAEAYQANGTPSAVLIAASGKIASPLAWGAQAITQLIHNATTSGLPAVPAAARAASAAGPSSQDKPGPAAGAAAPDLARTDQPVPAERGRRVQGQPVPIPHREL